MVNCGKPHGISTENNSNLYFFLLMYVRTRKIIIILLYNEFYILCKLLIIIMFLNNYYPESRKYVNKQRAHTRVNWFINRLTIMSLVVDTPHSQMQLIVIVIEFTSIRHAFLQQNFIYRHDFICKLFNISRYQTFSICPFFKSRALQSRLFSKLCSKMRSEHI